MADYPHGTPHRRDLDAVVGDRPAYLENRDGHSAWVSSRALELAGIDASTPDPDGGRIEREADGTPTGALHESAMDLVLDLVPPATADERERGLLGAQRFFHSLGITAWQDASVRPECQAAYEAPRRTRGADRPGRRGDDLRGRLGRRRDRGAHRAAGTRPDRPVRRDVGQVLPRRRPRDVHRGDARAVPRPRTAVRPTGPGSWSTILRCCGERSSRSMPPASRSTCTRSAIGRSARGSTRSRARRRPTARPTGGTTSPTSR